MSGRSPVLWGGALAAAEYLAAELGLEGDRLSRLALCAGSEAKARAWVESEAPMLQARDVRNPAGLFWWLFRHAESLPGSPSDMARRRALEVAQARRLDAWHGRRGLEAPAPAGEIPEALREWYQAAGLVERLAELERPAPAAAFAALERRICREALEELLGELEAAPADLPRYHGAELERWRRALEESKALEARRAARAEAERAELEAFAAERPELLEAPAPRPSSSSPAPRPSSSSPAPRPSSSAPTGEALALGDATVTRAELERLGGGSWAKGLRVLVASRGLTRQNAGRGGSDYVRDF